MLKECQDELDITSELIVETATAMQKRSLFGACPVCDHIGFKHHGDCVLLKIREKEF